LSQTLTLEMVSAILGTATCSVFAYGLARFKVPLKGLWMGLLFLTILLPDVMLLMPRVENFKHLDFFGILGFFNWCTGIDLRPDIFNTPLTFYLPTLLGVGLKGGLFIFIYIQFFSGLPAELEEAAWIDGAGPIRTFLQIVVPSSGTVFLTVFIFSFIWHWNDYYLALMYTLDETPLAVTLYDIQNQIYSVLGKTGASYATLYGTPPAACLLFLAPPLVVFLVLQKYFIQSIDRVGIVG
jgi:multiple sugar transport system permease protein